MSVQMRIYRFDKKYLIIFVFLLLSNILNLLLSNIVKIQQSEELIFIIIKGKCYHIEFPQKDRMKK